MIARRIITVLLLLLFFLVLELNQNTGWGWILTALLTVVFFVLWETGVFRHHWTLKIASWLLLLGGFAAILFLTWPPVKRVPATTAKDPARTAVVSVTGGQVQGVLNEKGDVELYTGIPYATPPVGDLRWKEPADPAPWDGVLLADHFAPMFMQPRNVPIYNSLYQIIGYHDYKWFDATDNYQPSVSEEALCVNVMKPAGDQTGLPVYVYVHGGSLQTGQPWFADYQGQSLAREGIVYVNFSYRLGVFGYLALEELAEESPNGSTGNYGLLDQVKALEWVRDNIAAFGGDPGNVTLGGESAGAAAVSALSTSPLAKGLFRRVFLESSTVAGKVPPHSFRLLPEALEAGEKLKKRYGAATVADLRALPAEAIVDSAYTEHHMTIDGYALTETPYESYQKGVHNEEAILHGYNSEESAAFLIFGNASLKDFEQRVRGYFKDYSDEILALYPASTDKEAKEMWAEIYGAVFFDYSHYCLTRLALQNGIPVRDYYFTKQNGRIGPYHSGEEVYFYGNIPEKSRLFDEKDRALMANAFGYLVNYTKTGDPNGPGLPEWPENTDPESLMELGENVSATPLSARKKAFFDILDRMQGFGE
jgi:para-nitrobenzyl esterase